MGTDMKKTAISFKQTAMVLLLMLCLVSVNIPFAAVQAFASENEQKTYTSGNYYYVLHDGYVSITRYKGKESKVEIPSSISGKPVSEICGGTFDGCATVRTIVVPDTVLYVSDDAFTGCRSLEVIISYTVDVIITAAEGVHIEYVNDSDLAEMQKEAEKTSEKDEGTSDRAKAPAGGREGLTTPPDLPADSEVGDFAYEDDSTPGESQKSDNGGSLQQKNQGSSAPAAKSPSGGSASPGSAGSHSEGSGQAASGTEFGKQPSAAGDKQENADAPSAGASRSGQPSSETDSGGSNDTSPEVNNETAAGNGVSAGQSSERDAADNDAGGTANTGNSGNGSAAAIIVFVICALAAAFFVHRKRRGKEDK